MSKEKRYFVSLLFLLYCFLCCNIVAFASEEALVAPEPIPFIIDTDFCSDVDDVLAVSTAMWFQDNGLTDVRAIGICCSSTRSTQALSALLYSHKYYDIPIGLDTENGIPMDNSYFMNMINGRTHSTEYVSNIVKLYRYILVTSETKVNIITLGQLINIERLMNSQPDEISPLTGYELLAEKCDTIYMIAAKANGQMENNLWYYGVNVPTNKYYNTTAITDAGVAIAKHFPTRCVWMTSELGGTFRAGNFFNLYDKKKTDIITNALLDFGTPQGCTAFDPMGIYIAMLEANGLLETKGLYLQEGTMRIYSWGTSAFTDFDPTRNHYRVIKTMPDNFYESEINQILAFEYEKRNNVKINW